MANTITYTSFLAANPALDAMLDPNGTAGVWNATTFEIINNSGGPFDGYVFQLTGTGFEYSEEDTPIYGNIYGLEIEDDAGNLIVSGTFDGQNDSLSSIYNFLRNDGAAAALQRLTFVDTTVTGSSSQDHLRVYSANGIDYQLSGEGGNDTLTFDQGYAITVILEGGEGDDTIQVFVANANELHVHGSADDGTGGEDETDTLEVGLTTGNQLTIHTMTGIDVLRFAETGTLEQLNLFESALDDLPDTLTIEGTGDSRGNVLYFTRPDEQQSAIDIDISGWNFVDWNRPNQLLYFAFGSGDFDDSFVGSSWKDVVYLGSGVDTFRGGAGADSLNGESGDDTFIYDTGEAGAEEYISGETGTDRIVVLGSVDFRGTNFYQVERVEFQAAATLEFDQTASAQNFGFKGQGGANHIVVTVTGSTFNAAGWWFDTWTAGTDTLTFNGNAGNNHLTGPNDGQAVYSFDGGDGFDRLTFNRSGSTANISIDLTDTAVQQQADGVSFVNVETITATLGSGDDEVIAGASFITVNAGGGEDTLTGGGQDDTLNGGDDDDIIDGGGAGDYLNGDGGDDEIYSRLDEGAGDIINGGSGIDYAFLDRSNATRSLVIDIGDPTIEIAIGDGSKIRNIERIEFRAGSGNDTLTGGAFADILSGNSGRDMIDGGGGADTINGGAGTDILDGGDGADTINGGAGIDIIDGGEGDDTLNGATEADTIEGGAGIDIIDGGAGNDNLSGGDGDDTIDGGAGIDTMHGGAGNDIFVVNNARDTIFEEVGEGTDTVRSAISFTLDDDLEHLTLTGVAYSGAGNAVANTITGNAAGNLLNGLAGNDTLRGEGGNDILIGDTGKDTLTGGTGNDTFKFTLKTHSSASHALADVITDFGDPGMGVDKIDLSALSAATLAYIHNKAFTAAGQVRINDITGTDVIVEVNLTGTSGADFSIRLAGTTLGSMSAADFVL